MTKITATFKNGLWIATWKSIGNELRSEPRAFRTAVELEAWANQNLSPCVIREG